MSRILLLSIRPEHVKRILNGEKKVELRRTRPKLNQGDLVLIYASTPIKALVGAFQVEKVLEDTPSNLWYRVQNSACISREEFDKYYIGTDRGIGIFFNKTCILQSPIALSGLRQCWPNFQPPQIYRYLSAVDINLIKNLSNLNCVFKGVSYQLPLL